MNNDPELPVEDQLATAFEAFRESIGRALAASAQQSVNETIERLAVVSGPFSVDSAEVEVVVRNISLRAGTSDTTSAGGSGPPHPRSKPTKAVKPSKGTRRRASSTPASGRRGRPDGPVKSAMIEAFRAAPDALHTPADLDAAIKQRGVEASTANLHQQLRRLVAGGVIERAGRGVYRLRPVRADS